MRVILCAFLAAFLAIPPGPASASEDTKWNVLIITVDSMRPDHMSLYGYERETTPHIAAFAEEALVFENAFASSASTSPGIVSLLTGYYPPVHAQTGRYSFYDAELAAPLRVLADEGYRILGYANDGPTYSDIGIQRRLRENAIKGRPGLEHLIDSRRWAEENGIARPFVAWAHLRETHLPYAPSEESAARWVDPAQTSPGVDAVKSHWMIFRPRGVDVPYRNAGEIAFTEEDVAAVRALYDGEMADVDARLGRAFADMRETGLLDDTVIVLTSDHGEELLEHGWVGHASTSYDGKLYDELIRIPLIVRLPGRALTGRFDNLVQAVDVMPTVFELLGIAQDRVEPPMQGQSLLPAVRGERAFSRDYAFAETTVKGWTTPRAETGQRIVAVRSETRKLIRIPGENGPQVEAYDLSKDPKELKDVYAARPADFADLERALDAWAEENRAVAAALVLSGAERRVASLMAALRETDLLAAVRHWEAIAMLERTWGLEVDPFFHHEPHKSAWQGIRLAASQLIAAALACHGEGGELRPIGVGESPEPGDWQCHR